MNTTNYKWLHLTSRGLPDQFYTKTPPPLPRPERLRQVAKELRLSLKAKSRLEWILWHEENGFNVSLTCRHFGLTRKNFYKWFKRFEESNLRTLEEKSRAPLHVRQKEFTSLQYQRIVALRRRNIRYGKMKLFHLYREDYPQDTKISPWKIQCIIIRSGIYYNPKKQSRINKKRVRSVKKKKITELKRLPVKGFLLCADTVVRYWMSNKRYILTGIDRYSKVAYARMYSTHSSASSRDFLYRLTFLLDGKISNIQTDNGSEFHKHFDSACTKLNINHYWSRVKTPKDNAVNERFNRTLQEEFIDQGNMTNDVALFNKKLTEWLIEYNFRRPHQTLDYMPPMNFHFRYHKVLPMCPSSTTS